MAFTQAQLDALDDAIAQGALTVKYADKEVTYRSLNEMFRIRERMAKALGVASTASGRRFISFDKGV